MCFKKTSGRFNEGHLNENVFGFLVEAKPTDVVFALRHARGDVSRRFTFFFFPTLTCHLPRREELHETSPHQSQRRAVLTGSHSLLHVSDD